MASIQQLLGSMKSDELTSHSVGQFDLLVVYSKARSQAFLMGRKERTCISMAAHKRFDCSFC